MRARGWVTGFLVATVGACAFPKIGFEQNVPSDADGQIDEQANESEPRWDKTPGAAARMRTLERPIMCRGSNPCDCDGDGYLAKTATCAGNDCDDFDARVHPEQDFVSESPTSERGGDWDCSTGVEKQYAARLDCTTLLGLQCNASAQGFVDDPACGAIADFYQCVPNLLTCSATKTGQRRQACR